MYDTATRVGLVKKRVHQKRRAFFGLSALCLLLFASLVEALTAFTGFDHSAALSMYGSILLYEDAGGYVLVGVISFIAAVVITVLCIKYRDWKKRKPSKEDR